MKTGITLVFFAGVLMTGYSASAAQAADLSCSEISYQQATATIAKDFLEYRMPRWTKDSATLGTQQPVLQFDRENTQVSDVWLVPFTAVGTAANREYFAIYDCKSGRIEYSVK